MQNSRSGKNTRPATPVDRGDEPRPQLAIGPHSARHDEPRAPGDPEGCKRLRHEHVDHRVLEFARDVGPARVVQSFGGGLAAHQRQHRGLEAAEAHVEIAALQHRPGQRCGALTPRFGEPRQRGTSGIPEAEELRGLVERLAGGIVLRVAEQAVAPHAFDVEQLAVAARHQQCDERKRGPRVREQRREEVAFEVMDADRRLPERVAECRGDACANQQCAGEAGSLRVGYSVEVAERRPGLGQDALREGDDAPNVVARRELRHDAAVDPVHRHLRMQRVREQATAVVVDGEAGFVAGSLDAEDEHGACGNGAGASRYTVRAAASPCRTRGCALPVARRRLRRGRPPVILIDCCPPLPSEEQAT